MRFFLFSQLNKNVDLALLRNIGDVTFHISHDHLRAFQYYCTYTVHQSKENIRSGIKARLFCYPVHGALIIFGNAGVNFSLGLCVYYIQINSYIYTCIYPRGKVVF